jgi:hypothetical protein
VGPLDFSAAASFGAALLASDLLQRFAALNWPAGIGWAKNVERQKAKSGNEMAS